VPTGGQAIIGTVASWSPVPRDNHPRFLTFIAIAKPASRGHEHRSVYERHGEAMLRVTRQDTPESIQLTLEGRLVGAWVDEANGAWQGVLDASLPVPVIVNLHDVSAVDSSGRALLLRMHQHGVVFDVRGCVMRELMREIERESDEARVHGAERVEGQTEGRRA
jgi:hypothetical protein